MEKKTPKQTEDTFNRMAKAMVKGNPKPNPKPKAKTKIEMEVEKKYCFNSIEIIFDDTKFDIYEYRNGPVAIIKANKDIIEKAKGNRLNEDSVLGYLFNQSHRNLEDLTLTYKMFINETTISIKDLNYCSITCKETK